MDRKVIMASANATAPQTSNHAIDHPESRKRPRLNLSATPKRSQRDVTSLQEPCADLAQQVIAEVFASLPVL
jgi:hypothetical protein